VNINTHREMIQQVADALGPALFPHPRGNNEHSFGHEKSLQDAIKKAILSHNNTPPATHKNSALRGVSCF